MSRVPPPPSAALLPAMGAPPDLLDSDTSEVRKGERLGATLGRERAGVMAAERERAVALTGRYAPNASSLPPRLSSVCVFLSLCLLLSVFRFLSFSVSLSSFLSFSHLVFFFISLALTVFLFLSLCLTLFSFLSVSISLFLFLPLVFLTFPDFSQTLR